MPKVKQLSFSLVVVLLILAVIGGAFAVFDPVRAGNLTLVDRLQDWKTAGKTIYVFNTVTNQSGEGTITEVGGDFFCITGTGGPLCFTLSTVTAVKVED